MTDRNLMGIIKRRAMLGGKIARMVMKYDKLTVRMRKDHPTCTDFDAEGRCQLCGARRPSALATPEGVGLVPAGKSDMICGDCGQLSSPLFERTDQQHGTQMLCVKCAKKFEEKLMLPDEEEEE